MTTETNHTPTPWRVKSRTTQGQFVTDTLIVNDKEHVIAKLHCEAQANSAFIVQAVNSHDALVAALKVAECEIQKGGTVDREIVLQRISEALKLAGAE
jgi:coenzyme F420-reducing hydrogenase delta subunit